MIEQMHDCIRCHGYGTEVFDEDDRECMDTCYHCGGSGKVDHETYRSDMLSAVAECMAWSAVNDYVRACNEDPDGEGFEFMAAENGMRSYDYRQCLAYDRVSMFLDKIEKLSSEEQDKYINFLEEGKSIDPLPYEFFE